LAAGGRFGVAVPGRLARLRPAWPPPGVIMVRPPPTPARPGNPAVACTAATAPRSGSPVPSAG